MPTTDKDLMARLTELVEEYGHQWKKIAPIIAAEGYRDKRGDPLSDNYLRKKMRKQETAVREKRSKPSEHENCSEPSDTDVGDVASAVLSVLMQKRLLESAVKHVLGNLERTPSGHAHSMPPQPERVTDRQWEKLSGTCDCELIKLFHGKRRELRLSISQMLDYVLWNFFDRPRLSFQSKDSEGSKELGEEAHAGS
jgi:hypothetical protein